LIRLVQREKVENIRVVHAQLNAYIDKRKEVVPVAQHAMLC
jgi:hypothetical protein